MYKIYSDFYQSKFIGVKYDKNFNFDLKKIIKKINKKTSFIVLANQIVLTVILKKLVKLTIFVKFK